ncbi:unnamed protein product [Rhizophagus irregularis]|nr:unnamed protein product [Rhizophagus irregularis]
MKTTKNSNELINWVEDFILFKLQSKVNFHNNLINFFGITDKENQNGQMKEYLLVMEYANGGSLRDYLKENFNNLTWKDKYELAYQLACAILFLHDKGIAYHDLYPGNIFLHKKTIKLANFTLLNRIKRVSENQSEPCLRFWNDSMGDIKETNVLGTPVDYSNLYTECWNNEPNKRPTMRQVIYKLRAMVTKSTQLFNSSNVIRSDTNDCLLK